MATHPRLTSEEVAELLWLLGQLGIGRGEEEAEHFIVCQSCGVAYDTSDMEEVARHAPAGHKGPRRN